MGAACTTTNTVIDTIAAKKVVCVETFDVICDSKSNIDISIVPAETLSLSANSCNLQEIGTLNRLTRLQRLSLNENHISSLENLQLETLVELSAKKNAVRELVSKRLRSLQVLKVEGNKIDYIDMDGFPAMLHLHADDNLLHKLSSKTHPILSSLRICNNRFSSIASLDVFPHLQQLYCDGNALAGTLWPILQHLQILSVASCNLVLSDCVFMFPALTKLCIGNNAITNMAFLQNCTQLRVLDLTRNRLTSLDSIPLLPLLQHLDVSFNRLADLSGIQHTPAVVSLNISANYLHVAEQTCEQLSMVTRLQTLDVRCNPLSKDFYAISALDVVQASCADSLEEHDVLHNVRLTNAQFSARMHFRSYLIFTLMDSLLVLDNIRISPAEQSLALELNAKYESLQLCDEDTMAHFGQSRTAHVQTRVAARGTVQFPATPTPAPMRRHGHLTSRMQPVTAEEVQFVTPVRHLISTAHLRSSQPPTASVAVVDVQLVPQEQEAVDSGILQGALQGALQSEKQQSTDIVEMCNIELNVENVSPDYHKLGAGSARRNRMPLSPLADIHVLPADWVMRKLAVQANLLQMISCPAITVKPDCNMLVKELKSNKPEFQQYEQLFQLQSSLSQSTAFKCNRVIKIWDRVGRQRLQECASPPMLLFYSAPTRDLIHLMNTGFAQLHHPILLSVSPVDVQPQLAQQRNKHRVLAVLATVGICKTAIPKFASLDELQDIMQHSQHSLVFHQGTAQEKIVVGSGQSCVACHLLEFTSTKLQ
eukprot:TRINITY_DN1171_c0_g1_i1.p2 TRINITY_DN1171_c0_g1~~TRINITY_DN1171_c0_g1_i1.p2  ORF type:complete len:765 (+),score=148.72 TRINITY_DN1171_c0_g1_i1:32-2326(+)